MAETSGEKNLRLTDNDVKVGVALPWDTFDAAGRLLLREGVVINSQNQLRALLERGMYRNGGIVDDTADQTPLEEQKLNPFIAVGELLQRATGLLQTIELGQADNAAQRIDRLCFDIQQLCNYDADAVLATMHLDREGPYSIIHSLCCAVLAEFIAKRLSIDQGRRVTVMAAALTSNVGMLELQEQLLSHQGALSGEMRENIRQHPLRSISLLRAAGIDDQDWLRLVEQHHEKSDGTGYPHGLSGDDIAKEASIVSVADRYHALISDRTERLGLAPTSSLRKLFTRKEGLDEECVLALIKELGIYPPGVYVRLFNGEIGMVTRRGMDGVTPQVTGLISPRGAPYIKPFVRDCSNTEFTIKEMIETLSIPVSNLYGLWGYGYLSA